MIIKNCNNCGIEIKMFECRAKKSKIFYCSKSCHRIFKNKIDNPSKKRDLSGKNNPMYGKRPKAWNKGLIGEKSHNWKGGIHKRKDGYVRINVNGKRKLFHRHILESKLLDGNVIHHIDHNPSNNSLDNLMIMQNQSEHIKFEKNNGKITSITSNNSKK